MNKPTLKKRGYGKCKQGYYVCKYPEKYIGNASDVMYRSGLELTAFKFLDMNPNVKKWASELITVPYYDVGKRKQRTYFTDLYIEFIDKQHEYKKTIIEVKPFAQTKPPSNRGRNYNKRISEYTTNICKWKAAAAFAKKNDMSFQILTEKDLK